MSILADKSRATLELGRVLEQLAAQAVSERAKELCIQCAPLEELSEVLRLQQQTSAAKNLIAKRGSPNFSGLASPGGCLQRAGMGGMLNTRELLRISGLLRVARMAKAYAGAGDTCLEPLFAAVTANKYLEEKINTAIIGEDEISDAASSELASIRRHIRAAHAKVREALQRIISSPSYSKILQDSIITQRGDRYVVPVKAEHKNDLPGLTHDVSASGATLFIEPAQVVGANNELRELEAKEKHEIERILYELSADCAAHGEALSRDYEALVSLDVIFARGKLSYEYDAAEPELCDNGQTELLRARHPLIPKAQVVPITIRLGVDFDTLVITGPNTGGKTVALKTLGLLSLMAACGMHIPADSGSRVCLYRTIYADIGDEQSIEQSLSTFSSHMTNIVAILEEAEPGCLILFDELGAGTDPVEGAALAVAIIEHARAFGAFIAATTHYAELKSYALTTPRVENASCEFDVETLRPTYRLLIGVPGKSNAFAISKRLGLSEQIIESARRHIDQGGTVLEDVLAKLEEKRRGLESERVQAESMRISAAEHERHAAEARAVLERERERATEKAKAEARHIVDEARRKSDTLIAELQEKLAGMSVKELNESRAKLRGALREVEREAVPELGEEPQIPQRPLKIGDTVEVMGQRAVILTINGEELTLQAGILKISALVSDVRLAPEKAEKSKVKSYNIQQSAPRTASARTELDLRGQMGEEGVLMMENFLDTAIVSGLETVTIIHGKGTGALRNAVHAALRGNKRIKSFRLGKYGEGESGVTIVTLK